MSVDDIKKHKKAIIYALTSKQPQETALSHLSSAINQKNVSRAAVPRPQAMKKQKHELSKKRSRSASNMEPVPRDKSVKRAKSAEAVINDRSKNMPS